jgi:hypothetical protein
MPRISREISRSHSGGLVLSGKIIRFTLHDHSHIFPHTKAFSSTWYVFPEFSDQREILLMVLVDKMPRGYRTVRYAVLKPDIYRLQEHRNDLISRLLDSDLQENCVLRWLGAVDSEVVQQAVTHKHELLPADSRKSFLQSSVVQEWLDRSLRYLWITLSHRTSKTILTNQC